MEKEVLSQHLGEENATELLRLTKAYDNYMLKFKKKINKMLEPLDLEVKSGLVYTKKE